MFLIRSYVKALYILNIFVICDEKLTKFSHDLYIYIS